jgi:hypothetical protein
LLTGIADGTIEPYEGAVGGLEARAHGGTQRREAHRGRPASGPAAGARRPRHRGARAASRHARVPGRDRALRGTAQPERRRCQGPDRPATDRAPRAPVVSQHLDRGPRGRPSGRRARPVRVARAPLRLTAVLGSRRARADPIRHLVDPRGPVAAAPPADGVRPGERHVRGHRPRATAHESDAHRLARRRAERGRQGPAADVAALAPRRDAHGRRRVRAVHRRGRAGR